MCILAFAPLGLAASAKRITVIVTAVDSASRVNHNRSTIVTPGKSNTDCTGSATTLGTLTTGSANCTTTTTPPRANEIDLQTTDVRNVVETEGMRLVLVCRANWSGSSCVTLRPGQHFEAETDGKTMWVSARLGGNMGKKITMKCQILDASQIEAPTAAVADLTACHSVFYENAGDPFEPVLAAEITKRGVIAVISNRSQADCVAGVLLASQTPTTTPFRLRSFGVMARESGVLLWQADLEGARPDPDPQGLAVSIVDAFMEELDRARGTRRVVTPGSR